MLIVSGKSVSAQNGANLVGDWKGESKCQVKNSPCHDEIVVYHIKKENEPDKFKVDADKIVNGQPVNMGTLDFIYDQKDQTFTCVFKNGTFKFIIKDNRMDGTLITTDNVLYRRISLKKED
jgi:hypothetical protein